MKSRRDIFTPILVAVTLAATILINGAAQVFRLNNTTVGEISNQYPVYFVPADYVFSIWSVIYTGLILYAIYQLLPRQRKNKKLRTIAPWAVFGNIANALWIMLWHYEYVFGSVMMMTLLLVSLLVIYYRIRMQDHDSDTAADRWLVHIPFSIYLAWITVAMIANVSVALYAVQWDGFGLEPQTWSAIMIGVALLITLSVVVPWRDIAYGLVIIWAIIGIALNFPDEPLIYNTAWTAVAVLSVLIIGFVGLYLHDHIFSSSSQKEKS